MVQYRGKIPDRNYSLKDFYDHGIIISWVAKYVHESKPALRCIFRSNGLLGEIRTTCYGTSYAVDVEWGWHTNERACLTTECKSIKEAKSILFEWFKSMGFQRKCTDWTAQSLQIAGKQLSLSSFVFK
jgi:hypothetical protein